MKVLFKNGVYCGYAEDTFQKQMLEKGCESKDWHEISKEDLEKYQQGSVGGENGTGYVLDTDTGLAVSAPPIPPKIYSEEEKISIAQSEFQQSLENLKNAYIESVLMNCSEDYLNSLKEDYNKLIEESNSKMEEILNG